ncbi:hypothetical protein K435DRAFT_496692 [Dendrothele bispora CBS 962.96]|uniref:F-box domain-containing protein n=1 Tax=Dendrothele bispora (strain CBS 962.96) TaxID=1314807 RepID=A0A4S8KXC0_DENBC|nr:hypothetical protein K435DRAFT_496692 [Dendrothele bispora CBS 962.96]
MEQTVLMSFDISLTVGLYSLPREILFEILKFCLPLDIIHMRLTCTLFNRLSTDLSLWTNVYRNSSFFLPPRPLQSIYDLERTLVRAQKLEAELEPSSTKKLVFKTDLELDICQEVNYFHPFQGRYVFVGTDYSLRLYDLWKKSYNIPCYHVEAIPGIRFDFQMQHPTVQDRIGLLGTIKTQ